MLAVTTPHAPCALKPHASASSRPQTLQLELGTRLAWRPAWHEMADQEQVANSWRKELPAWKLAPETELVRRNYEESLRGSHEPRPLVPPIFASSTYVLENAKEGEELSSNEGAVSCNKIYLPLCTVLAGQTL